MEVIDSRLGRSEYQTIYSRVPSIVNEHELWFLPQSENKPSLIEFKLGRSISNHYIIQILDITVEKEQLNTLSPSSIEFKLGRSIHYQ